MPIIPPFPDAPPKAGSKAAEQKPPMIRCTLNESDSGPECGYCGWPSGLGHGSKK